MTEDQGRGRRGVVAASQLSTASRKPQVRIGAVVALALAAGLIVWLATGGSGHSKHAARARPQAISAQNLAALPNLVHHPVYWVGPKAGFTYELTRTSDGRIFIRYLPVGVPIGTSRPNYLTIGTYPVKNAVAAIDTIARRDKTSPSAISGGGFAVQDTLHPKSVYLAYPGIPYQIEVFDPSPTQARQIAFSGQVARVGSGTGPTQATAAPPKATSVGGLRSLASSLGHPVYWVGAIPSTTLELTQTSDGRVFVRYLPLGVRVGARHPYLTVGTYPVGNAVAAVNRIAKRPGAQRVNVGGGVAVVDPAHPTSVYFAARGSKYQVEVFDPSATAARQLVATGRVAPVH